MPPLPVPDHCSSTFKYFLSVCVPTLRVEQIKNTKTIPRDYMSDIDGVYKWHSNNLKSSNSVECHLQTPGEENSKRRKKMILPWR